MTYIFSILQFTAPVCCVSDFKITILHYTTNVFLACKDVVAAVLLLLCVLRQLKQCLYAFAGHKLQAATITGQ